MRRFSPFMIGTFICFGLWLTSAAQEVQEKIDFDYGQKLINDGLFDLAALQFERFAEKYPGSPNTVQARFIRSECLFSLSRWQEALNSYLYLFIQHPAVPMLDRAQFRISECYENLGRIPEAIESYNRIASYFQQSSWVGESLYRSGRLSLENGNPEKAESTLRMLLDTMPDTEYRGKAVFILTDVWSSQGKDQLALDALKTIVTRPVSTEELMEARFRLGNTYEYLGEWLQAMSEYRFCVDAAVSGKWKPIAMYRLGRLLERESKDVEAEELYRKSVQIGKDSLASVRSLERLGTLLRFRGDLRSALESFQEMEKWAAGSKDCSWSLYRQGQCLVSMGQTGEAIRLFRLAVEDPLANAHLCKKAWLALGSANKLLEAPDLALSAFQEYLDRFPEDSLAPAAQMERARILIERSGSMEEAMASLRRIESRDRTGLFKAPARLLIAQGYEKDSRFDEAVRCYRSVVEIHPGTDAAETAQHALDSLDIFVANRSGLRMASVIESLIDERNSAESDWRAGFLFFDEFKQYRNAIRFFNRFLDKQGGSSSADSALFCIGRSYENLSVIERNPALQESSRMAFRRLLTQDPAGNLADNAAWRLALLQPQTSDSGIYRLFWALLARYPNSDVKDQWLHVLGQAATAMDSSEQAVRLSRVLVQNFPQSSCAEDAYLRWGTSLIRLNRISEADSVFSRYVSQYPEGRFVPQIAFLQAKRLSESPGKGNALEELHRVWIRFADSPWSDSAGLCLGQTMAKQNRFGDALSVFRRLLAKDSLVQVLVETGLSKRGYSLRKRILWETARAHEGLGNMIQAKAVFQQYLSEYRSISDRISALSALSRIAEKENRPEQAIDTLNRILAESPSDSIAEAVGLLRFRIGQYDQAIADFEKSLVLETSESDRAFVSSRIIVALCRQGKVPQADVRIGVFAKTYKSDSRFENWMAEFAYEKGLAYFQSKEFEPALNSFQEVTQKYKKSPLLPDAEFETGRVHLVTNRVEQALKILTDLPARYPENPICYKVYYNLGDHYYRSQQFENAMAAFQTAMRDSVHEEIAAGAMRYLVRVYDALRMWDSAILLIRQYLDRFPSAEDVLQKRVQLATITMKLEDYSRAIEILRDVQPHADPETEAEIQYWIGKCHFSMGHFETAAFEFLKVKYLSKSTRLPWDKTALYEAGLSFMRLREFAKAKDLFNKIIEEEGATSDWGRVARQRIQDIASGMTGAG